MKTIHETPCTLNTRINTIYRIRVKGYLPKVWDDWFEGVIFHNELNGDTSFTVALPDQAALFGILKKVRDSGMTLISINPY